MSGHSSAESSDLGYSFWRHTMHLAFFCFAFTLFFKNLIWSPFGNDLFQVLPLLLAAFSYIAFIGYIGRITPDLGSVLVALVLGFIGYIGINALLFGFVFPRIDSAYFKIGTNWIIVIVGLVLLMDGLRLHRVLKASTNHLSGRSRGGLWVLCFGAILLLVTEACSGLLRGFSIELFDFTRWSIALVLLPLAVGANLRRRMDQKLSCF